MGSDDKEFPKAFDSHTSSSAISIPEEKGQKNDTTKGRKRLHEFLKSCPKKELVRSSLDKEKKQGQLSKCKLTEELSKATASKGRKNLELKKLLNHSTPTNNQTPHRKQPRKGENPIRIPPSIEVCSDVGCTRTWICKNSACKAILTAEETFCKRCSCCICHLFDDNKDPSLWLVCASESGDHDWCGMSCHIECAFQRQKTGVVDLGQFMQLDGNYCCASCGKVSGIIGCWKKQLAIAKDARRVDVLCYRIFLSYRLLDGTSKFKEMHKIVEDAKATLETEVGPLSGVSCKKMARGIVSRLSVASDIQKLCSLGVDKADEWLSSTSQSDLKHKDSRPAACKFLFEETTSTTLVIVLKDASSLSSDAIKGYKLWYCKSTEKLNNKEPVIFPKAQRRILVTNLQPCTEYTFRIISFTDDGDLGHSESKCFTESVEIIHNHSKHGRSEGCSSSEKKESKPTIAGSSAFEVRKLGKILRLTWEQGEDCYSDLYKHNIEEESCDGSGLMKPETVEEDAEPVGACRLDLNLVSVPDLNAEITPPIENTPDENGCSSQNNQVPRSDGSGDSEMCAVSPVREVPVIESGPLCRKRSPMENEENYDGDSTLVNCSPLRFSNGSGRLDDSYEYCVKVVRWLECSGHIEKEFRMKFLTWFSLRSTEQERRVVVTFIRTLIEDPNCLADQLLDSFSKIVACKRPRNGFCSMLWH